MKVSGKKGVMMYAGVSLLSILVVLSLSLGWFSTLFAQDLPKIGADNPPVKVADPALVLNNAMVSVSEAVKPTVVAISVETKIDSKSMQSQIPEFHDFFKFFDMPDQGEQRSRGIGSGVLISTNGYIVTNNHVVENAIEDGIKVVTVDKKEHKAKLIGTDPLTDLAVIKIEGDGYPVAHFGKIEDVKIGQFVIAVGNPMGLNFTVTQGIVSAIGRAQLGLKRDSYAVENFIQTDAAINPGNSGGGLFGLDGSLVGINTAIATQTGSYMGYGFAIPIDLVKSVVMDLIDDGAINRGYLGVQITSIDETLAKSLGLSKVEGALINDVLKDSPAEKAGLKAEDVILEIDGKSVSTSNELQSIIAQKRAGDKVSVTLWRDNKKITKTVKLEPREKEDSASGDTEEDTKTGEKPKNEPIKFDKYGFSVTPLTPDTKKEYDVSYGVFISKVERFGHAADRGLFGNGVITKVDRKELKSTDQLKSVLESKSKGETVLLQIKYKERNQIVALEIQ